MSIIANTAAHRRNEDGIFGELVSTMKRWWAAYLMRRMENIAISQLMAMSDRELEDIGLTRSDITRRDERGTYTQRLT